MANKGSNVIDLVRKLQVTCIDETLDCDSEQIVENEAENAIPMCPYCKTRKLSARLQALRTESSELIFI